MRLTSIRGWVNSRPWICNALAMGWVLILFGSYVVLVLVMPEYLAYWFYGKELDELDEMGKLLVYVCLALFTFGMATLRFLLRHVTIDLADKMDSKLSEPGRENVRFCISVFLYVSSGALGLLEWWGYAFVSGLFAMVVAEAQLNGDVLGLIGTANEALIGSFILLLLIGPRMYNIPVSVPLFLSVIARCLGPLPRCHACWAMRVENTPTRLYPKLLKKLEYELERKSEFEAVLDDQLKASGGELDSELVEKLVALRTTLEHVYPEIAAAKDRVRVLISEGDRI